MAAAAGLVQIVRDFFLVHQSFRELFARFREGSLHFEEVKHLVADSDSSVLFRLKEQVHRLFREREVAEPLRRGEALFDLAVGSLFHEALKFRENLYQLEIYGPKIEALRVDTDGADELLVEFEKILRAASDRLGESLRETETLLEQTRKQLLVLLTDAVALGSEGDDDGAGIVTRFLLARRADVEAVYPEGIEALLARLHGNLLGGYLSAIRSHLASAHFDEAAALIREARARVAADAPDELRHLEAYARGMSFFLDGSYSQSVEQLSAWLEAPALAPVHIELALAAMGRLPSLVDGDGGGGWLARARDVITTLEKRGSDGR